MLDARFLKEAVCASARLPLLIEINPDEFPPKQPGKRSPVNLGLVLDRSQSMEGEKFELMLESACRAVESVGKDDGLAVVFFDDDVYTLYSGKGDQPKAVCGAIREVSVGSCTNLCGGWARGAELLEKLRTPGELSRVVLFTDGQANRGLVEPAVICKQVEEWRRRGVQTTTLGFGRGYHEELLRRMASDGQGNHAYIEDSQRLSAFFELEMSSLLKAKGTDVRLGFKASDGVKLRWLADVTEEEGQVCLANLVYGEPLAVLAELEIEGEPPEDLVDVVLTYLDLEEKTTKKLTLRIGLPVVDREEWEALESDEVVEAQIARDRAERFRQGAMHLFKEGLKEIALHALDRALELEKLPEEDQATIRDLINTSEAGDLEASYKKAAMYSHGHGHGHARTLTAYAPAASDEPQTVGKRVALPINLTPSLFQPMDRRPPEWSRVAGMLRGHFYGERVVRGNRSELGEGALLSAVTLYRLLQNRLLFLHELPTQLSGAEVAYPTTSLQNLRGQMKTRTALLKLGSVSAGCAALRRVCPFLVTGRRFPALDAALATMVTHRDSMAMTAGAGYTLLLGELLRCPEVPEPGFYLRTFLRAIEGMEKGEPYSCNAPVFRGWSGYLVDFLPAAIGRARKSSWTLAEAKEAWGSGPYLLEVVPTVLYALELHAHEPWKAIDEVSRESMEADTLAMLVGACVGAIHGPHRGWFLTDDLETLIDKCRNLEIFC